VELFLYIIPSSAMSVVNVDADESLCSMNDVSVPVILCMQVPKKTK